MDLAQMVSTRSTCLRRQVGAVVVREKRILSTGYNGAPSGMAHCDQVGCIREQLKVPSGERHEICRAIHAEQNVIIQAALHGVSMAGATIYCTHSPCRLCAKQLVQAKIVRLVTYGDYSDKEFSDLFQEAGVSFVKVSRPSTRINVKA